MTYNALRRKQQAVATGFCCSGDAVLRELVAQQIRQWPLASMATSAQTLKNVRITDPGTFLFRRRMVAVTIVNGDCFISLVLK